MASPILLVLGAGPGIGGGVAAAFASKGYRIALASRRSQPTTDNQLHVQADLSEPESVPQIFRTVQEKLGSPPSVVVYNAAVFAPDAATNPLETFTPANISAYHKSIAINTTSPLVALQQAIVGFRALPATASKTFIFTGNILNEKVIPGMLTFGLSKGATAYAIRGAVETAPYADEGISIYYADERRADGSPMGPNPNGDAAGEEYLGLAEHKGQGPWLWTFTKGKGYVDYGRK